MNSSLEHNFKDYRYKNCGGDEGDVAHDSPEADAEDYENSIENLPKCEICNQEFATKKDLRSHIIVHLGEPRIVLKRCSALKSLKKKEKDTYWLDPGTKGSLKLTLKKHQLVAGDELKLKLKKSSKSKDFTVVKNPLELERNEDNSDHEEVASDLADNVQMDDKEREEETDGQSYENVMVNEAEVYENEEDENYDDEEISNPLEDNEIPSVEANEGDSGVGSDMANPSERDDQNVDDIHAVGERSFDNNRDGSAAEENEDPEDADALEATCRETIENLKKLGEHSSSRNLSNIDMLQSSHNENSMEPVNMSLEDDGALSNLSKSSSYSLRSRSERESPRRRGGARDEGCDRSPEGNENFSWNHLSEDLTRKSNEEEAEEEEEEEEEEEARRKDGESPVHGGGESNLDGAGSLLQNFLIEHQRRNQNERTMANNLAPVETEYVSLEKLAETVSTCRVCNEKFRDIAQLDEHRSSAGHYRCNSSECSSLVFATSLELSMHKCQNHGNPVSPHVNRNSPHLNEGSPLLSRNSPHVLSSGSNTNSPHGVSLGSPNTANVPHMNSPLASPHNTHSPHHTQSPHHHTHSPTYNPASHLNNPPQQSAITPVNFEQLPAPVQQLAQQVQRMPLPTLPPGANTMIPGANYYPQPPGRPPPMYRMPGAPQPMHYPPHIAHLYPPYGPAPGAYAPMPGPPPMHPQMNHQQQMPRTRYPPHIQNPRAPRIPQSAPAPRQRMKRPGMQASQHPIQQQQRLAEPPGKQRRMDLLLPDRNEDADCHVIAQQKRNDGLPVIQNVQGATVQQTNRTDSTIHLTDSITLSVRQPAGSNSAQVQSPASGGTPKKPDPKAVANVLAARGITVTPAASKNKSSDSQKQSSCQQAQTQQRQSTVAAAPPSAVNVTALNLNSAISIIPASSQRKQPESQQQQQQQQQQQAPQAQTQFAVPQNKHPSQNKQSSDVERPPRPPTVDLTQDTPPAAPVVRRGRPPRAMLTCQVCDKNFPNQEMLSQHMATHRTTNKLLHKCNLCPAQYPTGQALTIHKQTYHKEVETYPPNGGIELAIPVVDLKSPQVLSRLTSLGIQSFIPLSQLSAQTGGYFGLPIITIDGARNPNACNLGALGATSILSLGPLKHLSNR